MNNKEFDEEGFITKLQALPDEIAMVHIFPKLKPESLVWLNRENYIKYHYTLNKLIPKGRHAQYPQGSFEAFIRYTIRNDYSFILKQLLIERKDKWLKMRDYHYDTSYFNTYLHFLTYFAFKNASYKCEQLVNTVGKAELGEKWYKRSKVRNIRWSN